MRYMIKNKVMNRYIKGVGLLLVALLLVIASPMAAVSGPTVSIPDGSASPGSEVTVQINIDGVTNMASADFWLHYDNTVVEVTAVVAVDLPGVTVGIDNPAGVTKLNWFSAAGWTGDFVMADVTLKALGTGCDTSVLDIEVKSLDNNIGNPITHIVVDGTFTVKTALTLDSTAGGSVTNPGEGTFFYDCADVVNLVATASGGNIFDEWTGDVATVVDVSAATTTVTMSGDYAITASFVAITVPSYLEIDKDANPYTIGQKNSGLTPEESTVTLTVTGKGQAAAITALDVVFSLDASGSMGSGVGSNMENAKDGTKAFIDKLDSTRDQAGVVSWDNAVIDSWALTNDFATMKSNVDTIFAAGGTNLEAGLAGAVAIMDAGKQTGSTRIIVFLSDGSGSYVGTATAAAKAAGYIIYAIGVGTGVDDTSLRDMADETGGSYHNALTADDIEDVFDDISGEISGVAGRNVVVTDVLQDYINLESACTIAPDTNTLNPDGTRTLQWDLGIVAIGEVWTVSFDVSSDDCGRVLANDYNLSDVTYDDATTATSVTKLFPKTYLIVRCPEDDVECLVLPGDPPEMSIQSLFIDPVEGPQNWPFEVFVNIGNSGGSEGAKTVSIYVNGVWEGSQSVTVGPGSGQNVLFLVERAVPGTYTVSVEGRETQFTVLGMGPPQPAPAPPLAVAGFSGGLGTGGIVAIIVIVIAIGIGLVVLLRREST